MPKSVIVQFAPESDWHFSDDPVRLSRRDEIVYQREPGTTTWRFTGAVVTPNEPGVTVDVKDHKVTVVDPCANPSTLCVVLTVLHQNGRSYPSPDPKIINEPQQLLPPIYVAVGLVVGAIVGALIDANTGPLASRGMLKGLIVGAILGAIIGVLLGRMLAGRRAP